MSDAWVTPHATGVRITVRVAPRASKSMIEGVKDGVLRVRLAAPPVEGAANEELIRVIANAFDVPKRAVSIARGERAKTKLVDIDGVTPADVIRITL